MISLCDNGAMHWLIGATGNALLALVFPTTCLGCQDRGTWFCDRCDAASQLTTLPTACAFCHRHSRRAGQLCSGDRRRTGLTGLVSYGEYRSTPLARAVTAIKYEGLFGGVPALAERAWPRWATLQELHATAIVPIPLGPNRRRERGFNQAELFARALSCRLAVPVRTELVRSRETASQVGLGRADRARNVAGAFSWTGPALRGPVILVDDVVTTGATLGAAARALRAGGCRTVWAASVAIDR